MATEAEVTVPAAGHLDVAARAQAQLVLRRDALLRATPRLAAHTASLARLLAAVFASGGRVGFAGNGGSAATADHLAAEFVGRFDRERGPLPAIAFSSGGAALTALANDYGYGAALARQVEAHLCAGDALVLLSTSGESDNLVSAARTACALGATVVALLDAPGTSLGSEADLVLACDVGDGAVAQELHLMAAHAACAIVEDLLAAGR